jgi:hypothetical protein
MTPPTNLSVEEILATKAFQKFIEAARHYCLIIETKQSDNHKDFYK